MNYARPEEAGIKSSNIKKYIEILENSNLSTHDLIIMRHGKIVFEKYWEPFNKDFLHRMYSVTKSFVSLAIGFLEQDGMINLDDKIVKYFPGELKNQPDENLNNQTIRHMLMMSTAKPGRNWFAARCNDRVAHYFENDRYESRPSGAIFEYDSSGSFVMGTLVERLTGKTLMEYLREKCLDKIGFSKEAYMLKCPGGHSWGDSALICKPTDLLKTAQFCMNKGKWNGEQLLNEKYVTDATTKQIDNNTHGLNEADSQGYGYQFWMTYDNSFFFNGMGCQFALCVPDKDLIMVYNGDNQGINMAKKIVFDNFFDLISRPSSDSELPANDAEYEELMQYADTLKLFAAKGNKHSDFEKEINNVTYVMNKNPMGITKMKFSFDDEYGTLYYTNEQGDKELKFGLCSNAFVPFPQEGYSDMVGSEKGDRLYDCAASAAWVSDRQLFISVQIIDAYFGRLNINIGFDEDKKLAVFMNKCAEDFLDEYEGFAGGKKA